MGDRYHPQIDQLLETYLGMGAYQIVVLLLAFLFSFCSTDGFAINFLAGRSTFHCDGDDENLTNAEGLNYNSSEYLNIDRSSICEPDNCTHWKYDRSIYMSTIISEFDLICKRAWLVDLVSSFYMAGRLLSCLTHGYFADRYGRKKVLILSHVLKLVGGVMSLYSPNYPTFAISRFIIAVGSTASCMASFVLLVECSGNKWRHRIGILFNSSPAIGTMILSLTAFMVRDYKNLQTIYTWPQFVLLFSYLIIDESPKWLISQGRSEEALKVMKKISIVNRSSRQLENSLSNSAEIETKNLLKSERSKTSFLRQFCSNGMFGSKALTEKTLILWMCWFVSTIIYYAISLNTGRLPGSIYLNTFLLALVEIPINLITIIVMEKFGGRITLGCSTTFAAISLFAMIPFMFYEDCEYVVTAFGILGKGLITVSYNALYVETAETYPTRIRSQAMGVSASFGRLSSMASSFLGGIMADFWRPLPNCIFGSLALISGSLFVFFPTINTGDLSSSLSRSH